MKKLLLCALVWSGCEKANPYYCADHPDHNCTLDGTSGGMPCTSNASCTDPGTLVCDTGKSPSTCVQCTPAQMSACTGVTPACGADDTCHACAAHTDCGAGGACLPDGSCGTDQTVSWVSPSGNESNDCSM